jgi:hypothetical protein
MKNIFAGLFVIVLNSGLCGQDFQREGAILHRTVSTDDPWKPMKYVSVEGGLNFGSDGVNNQFLTGLYTGGFMDSTYIENTASQLLPVNRFGMQSTIGITFGIETKDTSSNMLTFSLQKRTNITGKFSDDAFRLGFQGNTQFKGEEAEFSGTRFSALSWTQLKIGYVSKESENTHISVAFSGIIGNSYNEGIVHYGKLFTDSQGLFLDGSVAADYYSSDTANQSAFAVNGFGTSVDIGWNYVQKLKKGSAYYRVEFMDFGFINWNSKTIHQYTDTTFHYSGIDISQMFINQNYVVDLPEANNFIKQDTGETSRSTFLPAVIRASYQRNSADYRVFVKATAAIPVWSYALPYGSILAGYKFQKAKLQTTAGVAYGGYARLQVPCKLQTWVIKNATIEFGTPNVLSFIKPDTFSGSGAYVKLNYCF